MIDKEAKEIQRLYRIRDRKDYHGYFFTVTLIIVLTRIANELSTNISTYIQSSVIKEFFVNIGFTYQEGLSILTSISLASTAITMLAVFYKSLADHYGRKLLLIINAFGLATGMFLCYFSLNVYMYFAGVAIGSFFTQNDLQMVYILETSPKGKRTTYFSVIKALGILGMLLVPVLRDTVMANDSANWRSIYLVPALICLVICLATWLLLRESKIFVNDCIHYLETPKEERSTKKKESLAIGKAIRYIFKNHEILVPVIAYVSFGMCGMATYMYVESVMTINGLDAEDVTKALYVYPFVYAGLTLAAGFVGDKIGRKAVIVPCGFLVIAGYILFIIGCVNHWNPYLIGFLNGIYLGSYFIASEFTGVMLMEKAPTGIRASVISASYVLLMVSCLVGVGIMMFLMMKINLNFAAIMAIIPCMLVGTLIVLFKVKETKDNDLSNIKEEDVIKETK